MFAEAKEAFALFDKRGAGAIPSQSLGDVLRALGQNPTQNQVAELAQSVGGQDSECLFDPRDACRGRSRALSRVCAVDFNTFMNILNRPGGFEPAGTADEFIRGFQVFDKEGNGYIGQGELKYVLTSLGEKLSEEEVDELLQGVKVTPSVLSLRLSCSARTHARAVCATRETARATSTTSRSCTRFSDR